MPSCVRGMSRELERNERSLAAAVSISSRGFVRFVRPPVCVFYLVLNLITSLPLSKTYAQAPNALA